MINLNVAWLNLASAGVFEIFWVIGLKESNGFSRFYPSIITVLSLFISLYLFNKSLSMIHIGTAYAVWTGMGIFGSVILSYFMYQEPLNYTKLILLSFIFIGVIGLKTQS